MRQLHPDQLRVLRIRAFVAALLLFAVAASADLVFLVRVGLPFGLMSSIAMVVGILVVLALPRRRYHSWAYRMDEDELRIASGLMVSRETVVPFARVQHIDIVRGPLQRRFRLGSLVLHTAGTRSAAVHLPGLDAGEAERMRDHIRASIREDLV